MIQISSHLLFISAVGHRVSTVSSKWEEWRASACSDGTSGKQRIAKHLFNFELCRFIRRFIRSNVDSCQTIQSMISKQQDQSVLWGWSLLWKWHRASEGHQQRNHYANSPPLCLTSNNTALYICKAWQDTLHTALLSEPGHARTVTPNGRPLSPSEVTGPDFTLDSDRRAQDRQSYHVWHAWHFRGQTWLDAEIVPHCSKTRQNSNDLISGAVLVPLRGKVLD